MSSRRGAVRRTVPVVLLCWLAVTVAWSAWPAPAAAVEATALEAAPRDGAAPRAGVVPTGPWTWPLRGPRAVSRAFLPPATRYGAGHRGADLPATAGAPVRAAGGGRVSYAGLLAGRGVVVVSHGALRTTYEPVTAAAEVGDVVTGGGLLGTLEPGHPGCGAAACLHWGLRRGEDYLDPVRLVVTGPVRLLPLSPGGAATAARAPEARGPAAPGSEARGPAAPGPEARGPDALGLDARAAPGAGRPPAVAAPPPGAGPLLGPVPAVSAGPAGLQEASDAGGVSAPQAAAAAVALVAGLTLLVRPRPKTPGPLPPGPVPPGPRTPGPVTPAPVPRARTVWGGPAVERVGSTVVHLATERDRRRRAS